MLVIPWVAFVRLLLFALVVGALAALWLVARDDHTVIAGEPPAAMCRATPSTVV